MGPAAKPDRPGGSTLTAGNGIAVDTFRHEALLYGGLDEFVDRTVPFLREGIAAEEPILVVVSGAKIRALEAALGAAAKFVAFADMAQVGANPARIIPTWRRFVDTNPGARRLRGIGEPIYPERNPTELVECVRHEALLNVAFDGMPAWWLLCPYDTSTLPPGVIEEAHRTHPFIEREDSHADSQLYAGLAAAAAPFRAPLPEPHGVLASLAFDGAHLPAVRATVSRHAARVGLTSEPISDLVQAVNEVATNSVRHGGGSGHLRIWLDGDVLVCEIRDAGKLTDPLADRRRPEPDAPLGRGLWMANQLCDLVQVRAFDKETAIRLHMHRVRNR